MYKKIFCFFYLFLFIKIFSFETQVFNVPSDIYENISQVIDYAVKHSIDDLRINVIYDLKEDSIVIKEPIKKIVILGINTPSNCELDKTIIVNRSSDVSIQIENLSFKTFVNEGSIDYFSFFFSMCENLINNGTVKFSDIFGCEISNYYNWLSNGYLAVSQGKNVGTNFWGVKSILFETEGDSFILFGNKKRNILLLKEKDEIKNILQMDGEIIVRDKIVAKNFVDSSVYSASFMDLKGNMKVKGVKDSLFFDKETGSFLVSGNLILGQGITFGNRGKFNFADDGSFSLVLNLRDTLYFKDNRLDLKKLDVLSANLFTKSLTNLSDQPLIFRYNNGKNQYIRWGFSNLDNTGDFSFYEDSLGNIIFKRNLVVDPESKYNDVDLNTPIRVFSIVEKKVEKNSFKNFKFKNVILENNPEVIKIPEDDETVLVFEKSGFYNISYKVSFTSKNYKGTSLFLRVRLNGKEIANLNTGYKGFLEKDGYKFLNASAIVKMEKNDRLTFEYCTYDDSLNFGNFDIFEEKGSVFFSVNKIN
ncbi:MAG: hypothetical protein ABIN00_02395 [candidate division WOR-3 bacterium]